MRHISKKVKSIISGSFKNKLLLFLGAVLFIIILFTIIAYIIAAFNENACVISENGKEVKDPFWWVFLHISYPGHLQLDTGEEWWMRFLAVIITMLGMLFFEGILISFIVHELREKVESYKKGRARFRFKKHYVIIGWNSFTVSLIKNILLENNPLNKETEIIVFSPENSEDIQNKIKGALSAGQFNNIFVFSGELIKNEFRKLSLPQAKEIYILGEDCSEGNNNKNIETLFSISELIPENIKEKIECFLYLPDTDSFSLLKTRAFPDKLNEAMNIRPFNLYQGWARILWGSIDLSYKEKENQDAVSSLIIKSISSMKSEDYFHLVISGFNEMGRLLLEHSLQMAHFAGSKPSRITIIDQDLKTKREKFITRFPYYKNIESCKVEFLEADIYDGNTRDILLRESRNRNCRLAVVICATDSDEAYLSAELLPNELSIENIPVLVFQREGRGYKSLFSGVNSENNQEAAFNVNFFGWLDEHSDLIKVREKLAEGIHNEYLEYLKAQGKYNPSGINHQEWERLPDNYKWSNRYQADSMILKLSVVGRKIELGISKRELYSFNEKELSLLSEMEHQRWCAEKILEGWKYDAERNNSLKLHPDLVPYEKLSVTQQKFDENAVKVMPMLLRKYCNFDIV